MTKVFHLSDETYAGLADQIEKAGLRIEDHLRVNDRGVALTNEAIQAIAASGSPRMAELKGNANLQGIGISRHPSFVHPLSGFFDADCKHINSWGAVSMLISVAQGWIEEGNRSTAQQSLATTVYAIAPRLDLPTLQRQARYDDRALLKLCSHVHEGLILRADKKANNSDR
ncbi:hypothetical protein H6F89_28635 [Cyanobacteria bacterium FACHB-63]|nr:hypothetical protein [Cyanobacteria bacterium FACHB-63]